MFKKKVAITAKQVLHVMFGDSKHDIDPGFVEQSVKFLGIKRRRHKLEGAGFPSHIKG